MLTRLRNSFNYRNVDENVANCIKKLSNNLEINRESFGRYNYLCMVLNNKQITDNITLVDENLTELMDMIFNLNSVVAEMHKHLKSRGLIFLHKITIRLFTQGGIIMYVIHENVGYEDYEDITKQQLSYLNPELYYTTQIQPVRHEKIMALPISFMIDDENVSHENMLIITRNDDDELIVEHFEPKGHMPYPHPVHDEIRILIKTLFSSEISDSSKIHFIEINKICPVQKLQSHIKTGKFMGSCTTFSIWYAILRLLNPEQPYAQTYKSMERYLLETSNPNAVIKNVVGAFIRLINLRSDGTMGDIPDPASRRRISFNNLQPVELSSGHGGRKKHVKNKKTKIKRNKKNRTKKYRTKKYKK